ncbi:MAG: tetratricopeptide repeat protein, partial [Chloroflexi bacterium]|nr:tetratricopeptide repeat protein [Chloroflexota bacterium]
MQTTLIEQLVEIGEPSDQRRFVQSQTALLDPAVIREMKAMADLAVRAETPRALRIAESALVVCNMLDDPPSLALSMRAKAQALHLLGQLEDALVAYDEASEIFGRDGNPVESARSLIGKIDVLLYLGRPYDALETANQCRATFLAHNESLLEAKVALNQGNIYQRLDRYTDALAVYRTARQVFQRHDEQLLVALADTNLGHSYSYTAQFRQAQRALKQAGDVYRQLDLKTALAMNESNLGLLYGLQGRYNQALITLTSSRAIFQEVEIPRNMATVDLDIADIYNALNHTSRALETYDAALDTFRDLGFVSDIAKGVFGKATVHVQLGEHQSADAELAEAQRYFDDEDNQVYLGLVELHQAIMMQANDRHQDALETIQESMRRFLSANLPVKTAYARLVEGESLRALGREDEAISDFNNALATGESLRLPWLLFESHAALGRVYMEREPRQARAHLASAVDAVERTRRSLQPEELKAAFLQDKQDSYANLVALCLAQGGDEDIEEAFRYVERSKSQSLLDILAGHVEVDPESDSRIDPRIGSRLQTLRQELNSYYSALDQRGMGDGQRGVVMDDAMLERIESGEKEFMELVAQAQLQNGQAASILHSTTVDMAVVREHLKDTGTTLVEYFQIGDEILAFVMGQGGDTRVVRNLTSSGEVSATHRRLQFQLRKISLGSQPDPRVEEGLLEGTILHLNELYRALIKPIESLLSERVIVVPHGMLHYIPFHALHDGESYFIDH